MAKNANPQRLAQAMASGPPLRVAGTISGSSLVNVRDRTAAPPPIVFLHDDEARRQMSNGDQFKANRRVFRENKPSVDFRGGRNWPAAPAFLRRSQSALPERGQTRAAAWFADYLGIRPCIALRREIAVVDLAALALKKGDLSRDLFGPQFLFETVAGL